MEWTFPDFQVTPEGGDRLFRLGALKGTSLIDLTVEHPVQYLSAKNSKTTSKEMKEYVEWVDMHFVIDRKTRGDAQECTFCRFFVHDETAR